MNQMPVRPAHRAVTAAWQRASILFASAVVALFVSLTSVVASPPDPPPSLCVEESGHCATAAAPGQIKWHPGHYLAIGHYLSSNATMKAPQDMAASISEIASMQTIQGVFVRLDWGALETSKGVYNFELVDQILAAAQAAGKHVIIATAAFVMSDGNVDYQVAQGRFPAYLRDSYDGLYDGPTESHVDAKFWLQPIMDRYIALHAALAARYDTHPYFEGISTGETTSSVSSPDFSTSAKLTQLKRLVAALETQWPHTNVFIQADAGLGSLNADFLRYMIAHRMILSGPDIRPNDFVPGGAGGTQFQRIYQGIDGGVDYRKQIACGMEVQSTNMGGNHTPIAAILDPTTTLQFIYQQAQNPLHCSYIIWNRKYYGYPVNGTDNDIFWDTAPSGYTNNHPTIKEFLSQDASRIPVVTTLPGNYPGAVVR